ncbi:MAG: cell division protein FtsB [Chromatocurvus sp.]
MLRWLLAVLVGLLILLQYRLWFADGSLAERKRLQQQVESSERENALLRERNDALSREVLELQSGNAVVEERAREELGLIREGEIFYRFVEDNDRERHSAGENHR